MQGCMICVVVVGGVEMIWRPSVDFDLSDIASSRYMLPFVVKYSDMYLDSLPHLARLPYGTIVNES